MRRHLLPWNRHRRVECTNSAGARLSDGSLPRVHIARLHACAANASGLGDGASQRTYQVRALQRWGDCADRRGGSSPGLYGYGRNSGPWRPAAAVRSAFRDFGADRRGTLLNATFVDNFWKPIWVGRGMSPGPVLTLPRGRKGAWKACSRVEVLYYLRPSERGPLAARIRHSRRRQYVPFCVAFGTRLERSAVV